MKPHDHTVIDILQSGSYPTCEHPDTDTDRVCYGCLREAFAKLGLERDAARASASQFERLLAIEEELRGKAEAERDAARAEVQKMDRIHSEAARRVEELRAKIEKLRAELMTMTTMWNGLRTAMGIKNRQIDQLLEHCPLPECERCAEIVCPFQEPLHFHHDGCPACAEASNP